LKVEFASISIALNLPKRQVKITPKKKMEINPARKDCFSTLPFQNGNHHQEWWALRGKMKKIEVRGIH
jgi:hypothetical protein